MSCADNEYCENLYKNDPKYSPKVKKLDEKRRELLRTVTQNDLVWTDFPLRNDPKQEMKDAPYRIQISRVVAKSGFFIPVTADESFCFAAQWSVFPLTSAVMDQFAFGANYVQRKFMSNQSPHIFDFETYSEYLRGTLYASAVCVGAHKIWAISGKGQRINYGFHFSEKGRRNPTKYCGDGWRIVQPEGAFHEADKCFWDYSQLMQFMRKLTTKDGKSLDLRDELNKKNPALWYDSSNGPQRLP